MGYSNSGCSPGKTGCPALQGGLRGFGGGQGGPAWHGGGAAGNGATLRSGGRREACGAFVAPATGAKEDDELRRGFGGAPGLEMQKKRHGDEEGSEADPVEGFITFFACWGRRTIWWRFCGGCSRRRRLQRRQNAFGWGPGEAVEARRRSGRLRWSFSSSLHADGGSGCKTIILSPLSLCGSHRRWLAQVVSWWLRGGGE